MRIEIRVRRSQNIGASENWRRSSNSISSRSKEKTNVAYENAGYCWKRSKRLQIAGTHLATRYYISVMHNLNSKGAHCMASARFNNNKKKGYSSGIGLYNSLSCIQIFENRFTSVQADFLLTLGTFFSPVQENRRLNQFFKPKFRFSHYFWQIIGYKTKIVSNI